MIHTPAELSHAIGKYGLDQVTLEPYFRGVDIDFNTIIQNGIIEWYGFVENFPPLQPSFLEDGSLCHHTITLEEQGEMVTYMQHIIELAHIETAFLHTELRLRRDEG